MIWLWHVLFDGTWLCRCEHSHRYREYLWAEKIWRNWT